MLSNRRRSVGDPEALQRHVDMSRLDHRLERLKLRVGTILNRFDRRIAHGGHSGGAQVQRGAAGRVEERRVRSSQIARDVQDMRDEVAAMSERSDRMTQMLRRIRREMITRRSSRSRSVGDNADEISEDASTLHGDLNDSNAGSSRQVSQSYINLSSTVVTSSRIRSSDLLRGSLRDYLSDIFNEGNESAMSEQRRGLSDAQVSTLGSRRATKTLEDPCCICLEMVVKEDMVTRLPCCHAFHTSCIRRWLVQMASCPLCVAAVECGST